MLASLGLKRKQVLVETLVVAKFSGTDPHSLRANDKDSCNSENYTSSIWCGLTLTQKLMPAERRCKLDGR